MTTDFLKWTDENHVFLAMLAHQLLSGNLSDNKEIQLLTSKKNTHIVEIHTEINPLKKETLVVKSYNVTEIKSLPPNIQENVAQSLSRSTPINQVVCVIVFGIIAGKTAANFMSLGIPGILGMQTDLSAEQLVRNFNNMK